jgi:hypothetical protein
VAHLHFPNSNLWIEVHNFADIYFILLTSYSLCFCQHIWEIFGKSNMTRFYPMIALRVFILGFTLYTCMKIKQWNLLKEY